MVIVTSKGEADNCKCFDEFEPKFEHGHWLCRGKKNFRIFSCGEAQPPLCKCQKGQKEVVLDIGETNCANAQGYDSLHCNPKETWEPYYSSHPEKRIYF